MSPTFYPAARHAFPEVLDLLRRFRRDQTGSYAIITALTMPALLGLVGLGSEVGLWYYNHQHLQSAADSGAISAATTYSIQGNSTGLITQAQAATATYGFVAGANNVVVTLHQPPLSGSYTSTTNAAEVIVSQPQTRLFSSLFSSSQLTISARAVAVGNGGLGCVLSLNTTASGATVIKGTSAVNLSGCSLMDNSSNSSALTLNGGGTLSALSVNVVGNVSGTSNITTTLGINTGATPASDPYADSSYPSFSGCDKHNFSSKKTETINPGVYCGGMSLNAGANVTLNPGVYYLDQGSLSVNGGATLSGTGVTLVFTSSTGNNYATASVNGGATINLTPPTNGSTAGIVFFGDRNMPVGTGFSFEGGASQVLGGALYLPRGAVSFAGGADTTTACTQLVADTITFSGNSNFAINCAGYGTRPIGSRLAKLVE